MATSGNSRDGHQWQLRDGNQWQLTDGNQWQPRDGNQWQFIFKFKVHFKN
jgi:hypothetical protein